MTTTSYPDNYFEGPEKNLEIDFVRGVGNSRGCRAFTRPQLDAICHEAKCLILSSATNEFFDAYVLSESSIFVYSHKIIMKTCGTTTLLLCFPVILGYAKELGMEMEWMGYSRKNFTLPTQQIFPHQSFQQEVAFLLDIPDSAHGSCHVLGPMTGDHWYVFVVDHSTHEKSKYRNIDIKMFGIDPAVAACFYQGDKCQTAEDATRISGICNLIPGATIDAKLFEPCGYSMNAQLYDSYTTMHITPQPEFSYVSFETNARLASYSSLIRNVLNTFRPERVVVTMFADQGGLAEIKDSVFNEPMLTAALAGSYSRTNLTSTTFETDYCVTMGNWKRVSVPPLSAVALDATACSSLLDALSGEGCSLSSGRTSPTGSLSSVQDSSDGEERVCISLDDSFPESPSSRKRHVSCNRPKSAQLPDHLSLSPQW